MVEALTGSFARMWALAAFGPATLRAFARARPSLDRDASTPALLLAGPGAVPPTYVSICMPTCARLLE